MGYTAKQVMKILEENGWVLDRIDSSHHIYRKVGFVRSVPVPYHKNKDSDLGVFAKKILKQAHIDPETKKEISE